MNRDNILKVADAIEADPERFNIAHIDDCIVGFAERLGQCDIWQFFDINPAGAASRRLIMPKDWLVSGEYTADRAAAVLRRFAKTGEVDWSVTAAPAEVSA